ncbi:MAG: hypothetical protein M3Y41_18985 [Pseudomonadota bacterium]|nr:hypothetical protein [Pseudomonadota bacterium]
MLDRQRILALIPHQGAMCLLDEAVEWDSARILCLARSHLAPDNPLRCGGRLGALAGVEYGLQAAALHGALLAGQPQPVGYLAGLREVEFLARYLDAPVLGVLRVEATLALRQVAGLIYRFGIAAEDGRALVVGRAVISLPPA